MKRLGFVDIPELAIFSILVVTNLVGMVLDEDVSKCQILIGVAFTGTKYMKWMTSRGRQRICGDYTVQINNAGWLFRDTEATQYSGGWTLPGASL